MKLLLLSLFLLSPIAAQEPRKQLRVQLPRIIEHLQALARYGRNPQGGVSRVAYSDADLEGRQYVIGLMRQAALEVNIDAAGNIIGSRPGTDRSLKPLLIGSHIDSVPDGGNYDGDVGVLSAIEVAQLLAEYHVQLRHPLQVIIFQNEEGGTVGSHAISSGLDEKLLARVSQSRKSIREGIRFIGGDPTSLAEARKPPGSIAGYFELHIEQGNILEREKINIGVVQGIVGILHSEVTVEGFANHAGTTPMNQRHDALLAAARFIEKVNEVITALPGAQVGTVGWVKVQPGAYNVIPGTVILGLELRDLEERKIKELFNRIRSESDTIGQLNGTKFSFTEPLLTDPALTDIGFQHLIDSAAKGLGLSTKPMPSGAGHDAQEMAKIGPVGMIFIPSVGGISHSPREFSHPEDIGRGANVLLETVLKFDASRTKN